MAPGPGHTSHNVQNEIRRDQMKPETCFALNNDKDQHKVGLIVSLGYPHHALYCLRGFSTTLQNMHLAPMWCGPTESIQFLRLEVRR